MDRNDTAPIVRRALEEDLPDITSEAIFTGVDRGTAAFLIKAEGVLAGLMFAEETVAELDDSSEFIRLKDDGDAVRPGDIVAEVSASVIAFSRVNGRAELHAARLGHCRDDQVCNVNAIAKPSGKFVAGIFQPRPRRERWRCPCRHG